MGSERETEKEREGLGVISPPSTQPNSPSPSSSSSSNTSSTTTSINQPSSLAVLSAVANEVRTVPEETAVSESSSTSASSASLNINAPEFTPRIPLLSDGRPKRIRCHFWPFCANEGVCIYWHPSELCKNEELYGKGSCMFGTKCFFVHAEDLERLKNGPPPAGPTNSTANPNASGTSKKNGLKDSSTPGTGNGTGNKRRNGNKYNGTRKQRFRNASQSQQHNLPYAPSHLQPPSTYPQECDYEFDYTAPYAMVAQEEGVISASQFVPVLQGVHQHPHQPAMNVPVSVPMSLVDPAIAGTQYHSNGVAHETAHLNLGNINSNSTENETSTLNMESEEGVVSGLCHVPVPSHPHQHAHVNQYQYTQHPGSHRPNNLEIVNAVNGYNGYGYTGFEVNEYGYDVGEIGLNGNNINGVSGNGFEVSVNNEEGTV
ncbi:hypothetical protein BKA69DRAFT_1098427 [Paraphysoderma sedebokerense]|nr:hypothetical protein BKA69DRAFT_1098427 [Paraphysoderma sedebokerense]